MAWLGSIRASFCVILWAGNLWLPDVSGLEWGILKSLTGSGGKCVHIASDSLANDAPLELVQCSLGSPGQQFDVTDWGNYWNVPGPLVFRSGRCVTGDPRSPPKNEGVNTTAWDCLDYGHQLWTISGSALGSASPFQLVGSNGKCLTAESGGLYFDQYTCYTQSNAPHQWFIMEHVFSTVGLESVGIAGKCIHVKGESQANGATLDLATCAPSVSQIVFAGELSQYVSTPGPLEFLSGKCLTGSASDVHDGVNMTISDCSDPIAPHQKWQVVGGVPFSSPFQLVGSNGKCLTAESRGAYIDQWGCDNLVRAPHQWFTPRQLNSVGILGSVFWPGLCVHIKGDSLNNGAGLEMIACDPASVAQQFDIADWGGYKSVAGRLQFLSGRCITGDSSSSANGVATITWSCSDQPQQKFLMRSGSFLETNSFQLQASNTGLCLNPSPGDKGATFSQWECGADYTSAPHQFFKVYSNGVTPPAAAAAPPPPPPVPRCLVSQEPCDPGIPHCCDGTYCFTLYSSSYCRDCLPEGHSCGVSPLAQRCCNCCSCRLNADKTHGYCQPGGCVGQVGGDCTALPCCGELTCQTWGRKQVCRPRQPSCGDGDGCTHCCSSRCSESTVGGDASLDQLDHATYQADIPYFAPSTCACGGSANICKGDSDCCSGFCGIDYYCAD